MYTLIAGAMLLCSGQTNTFDVQLYVYPNAKWIQAQFTDTDGANGSFNSEFAGLTEEGRCLKSEEITLCVNNTEDKAEISVVVENEGAKHVETGSLQCTPTNK